MRDNRMDKTYQKFLRAGIDLSSVGVERRTYNEPYDNFQFISLLLYYTRYAPLLPPGWLP